MASPSEGPVRPPRLRRRIGGILAVLATTVAGTAPTAHAQLTGDTHADLSPSQDSCNEPVLNAGCSLLLEASTWSQVDHPAQATSDGPPPGRAFLQSLLIPGLSQYQQGTWRWIAYAAVEAVTWGLYLDRRSAGRSLRDDYRNLAWDVARMGVSQGPRMDGGFTYYETLSKWDRSGAWDTDGGAGGLQPETDPTTFNGSVWALANEIFSLGPDDGPGTPAYERAIAYYRDNGFGPEFLWDWRSDPTAKGRFGDLIQTSDKRFKQATTALGVILANHLLSGIDGLVTARLRTMPTGQESQIEIGISIPAARARTR